VSSDAATGRSLASYVEALLAGLDAHNAAAGLRIRDLAAERTARIRLDDEVVLATFVAGELRVQQDDADVVADGSGATDRDTVVDLLTGRLEAADALLTGRIEIFGQPDDVVAMLQIIETLLDAAARAPELQQLERELVAAHPIAATPLDHATPAWYPDEIPRTERDLLARLDLLNGATSSVPRDRPTSSRPPDGTTSSRPPASPTSSRPPDGTAH
jgi:putative sterol carrier protein